MALCFKKKYSNAQILTMAICGVVIASIFIWAIHIFGELRNGKITYFEDGYMVDVEVIDQSAIDFFGIDGLPKDANVNEDKYYEKKAYHYTVHNVDKKAAARYLKYSSNDVAIVKLQEDIQFFLHILTNKSVRIRDFM